VARLDEATAAEVAAAHVAAPRVGGAVARAAYAQLVDECDDLFRRLTAADAPGHVSVRFTRCPTPYTSAEELITSIRRHRLLEVTTVAGQLDRRHPLMDGAPGGAFDRFRAVHDVLGHGALAVGFDRHGEFAAWRHQERFHSRLARRALATELHGEHSVRWTTGELAEHKAVLLDDRLMRRARMGRSAS
jgi:hypothetical protein